MACRPEGNCLKAVLIWVFPIPKFQILAKKSGDKLFSGNNSTIMWNAQERT
jgi:hypothetical protein